MSELNVSALRQFQSMWEPVVKAIPAVLEMAEKKADLDKALQVHAATVEKARKASEKEVARIAADVASAQAQLDAMGVQKAALAVQHQQLQADLLQRLERAEAEAKAAEARAVAVQIACDSKSAAAEAEAKARIDAAKSAADAQTQVLMADIADLEKRRAAAEKALDTLRAKLG